MRDERIGLWMIASSLVVIVVISALLVRADLSRRRSEIRGRGVSLVRLLSRMPHDRLVTESGQQGILQLIKHTQGGRDLAYAAVVDTAGWPVEEVSAEGVIVPRAPIGEEPSTWLAERVLELEEDGSCIREFRAPVFAEGNLVAEVRLGFFDPGYTALLELAPFLALLALPIFLLTPFAYLLIRREIRPLAHAQGQLHALLEGGAPVRPTAPSGGVVGEFMKSFNRFVELAEERREELRKEQTGLLAASKVASYHRGRIEAVLATLPDAVVVLDEAGTVTYANPKLEALTGTPVADALTRKPREWCRDPELAGFLGRFERDGARLSRADTLDFAPGGGAGRRLRVAAHPLVPTTSGVAIPGTLVLIRDVTGEALERSAQAEFVSHVAHELKSPLNVLGIYSESLMGKDGESEDFRIEACNVIHDEVERLSTLISTLLSIARIESGAVAIERQRIRPHDFLRDVLDTVARTRPGAALSFELEVDPDFPPLYVDKALLRVSISNLLTNAVKYNREGGRVLLAAEETADAVCIRVSDTGVGIPREDQPRVFEKFYRAQSAAVTGVGGHGLGLTLSKQIVEIHGGHVEVVSEPDQGSTFSIVLPKLPALLREEAA